MGAAQCTTCPRGAAACTFTTEAAVIVADHERNERPVVPVDSEGSSAEESMPMILISDPGEDLDDEMTFIMLRHLVAVGMVDVRGIVTTLEPAFDRARLCRGTLDTLGLYGVPIGVGSDGGDDRGQHSAEKFEAWAHTYMPVAHSEASAGLEPGRRLLDRLYREAEPKSLTLVVIAALKDPALFLRDAEDLFVEKTQQVVIMGGVEAWDRERDCVELVPDAAHNNLFDIASARYFYKRCQELGVPLVVLSRWAAYAAKVPRSCYDELAALGSAIGCRLRNAQRASIEDLWSRACAREGDAERRGLPARCDRAWFVKTFCGGADDSGRGGDDTIWDLVAGFMQYDTIATIAAFPSLRAKFFSPEVVTGAKGVRHLVIGRSEEKHGVACPADLAEFMHTAFSAGLAYNHRYKMRLILFVQPRWDNRGDDLLAIVMIRTLYELGLVDCLGIVVGSPPVTSGRVKEQGESTLLMAQEIESTLRMLGLGHVRVLVAEAGNSSVSVVDHLARLYAQAPPAGVALVIDAALTDVCDFVAGHPKDFREKTQSVVLIGGGEVTVDVDDEHEIMPDPTGGNYRLDKSAARIFFRKAQYALVPLILLSRHFSKGCPLPRALFDELGVHGGAVGRRLLEAQRGSIAMLWQSSCAPPGRDDLRRGLPDYCTRDWFVQRFCREGATVNDTDIWSSIESFNFYMAFAVLAAIPPVFAHIGQGGLVDVRSVEHMLIGVDAEHTGVVDAEKLRRLMYQCLFMGARLNGSEFAAAPPPRIPLRPGADWTFDASLGSLDWLFDTPVTGAAYAVRAVRAFAHQSSVQKFASAHSNATVQSAMFRRGHTEAFS